MLDNRSRHLRQLSYELELDYVEEAGEQLLPFLKDFQLFRRGRQQQLLHALEERHPMLDYRLHIFDYKYQRGRRKERRVYYQTVFFIRSKKLGLPAFQMRPASLLDHLAQWMRLRQDIDFSEFPEFSRQYELRGEDEDYIRASMNERVLEFFTEHKNWHLEGVNYYLIFYKKNRLVPVQEIRSFYQIGHYLAKLLEAKDLGLSYD